MKTRSLHHVCRQAFLIGVGLFFVSQILVWDAMNSTERPKAGTSQTVVKYLLQFPPEYKMDKVDRLTPSFPSTYLLSMWESYKKISGDSPRSDWTARVNTSIRRNFFPGATRNSKVVTRTGEVLIAGTHSSLGNAVDRLVHLITTPKRKCRKLVNVGGYSCLGKPEGTKNICLDEDVRPVPFDCLIYSFGVGHDMSFDGKAVNYGCAVYTFDADRSYKNYSRHIVDDLIFIKVRLGHAKFVQNMVTKNGIDQIIYRPLHQIMKALKHLNVSIDLMKVDIENEEWKVFEKSIFKTKILERIRQIALEIHLDDFQNEEILKNETKLLEATEKYLRVLEGFESRGFRLAHYEPNYRGTKVVTIANRTFHLFSETLWLNPFALDHLNEDFMGSFYEDYEFPPKDLLPFTRAPATEISAV